MEEKIKQSTESGNRLVPKIRKAKKFGQGQPAWTAQSGLDRCFFEILL